MRTIAGNLHKTLYSMDALEINQLRALLIQAGQLEQGISDSPEAQQLLPQARQITDLAASAFLFRWSMLNPDFCGVDILDEKYLGRMECDLARLQQCRDCELDIKIPEGFEFYALFPEQYASAAWAWAQEYVASKADQLVIVGIRSIGTTLSAVVAGTLQAMGWKVARNTVRLTGHPFQRKLTVTQAELQHAKWALIVDEGPGISGSSMAATANACAQAGISPEHIFFFPGHEKKPGPAAGEDTRRWWRMIRRYYCSTEALRWNGQSLPDILLRASMNALAKPGLGGRIENCGAGEWRKHAYAAPELWPACSGSFERSKFLAFVPEGKPVLWKFAGLGAFISSSETGPYRLERDLRNKAEEGWSPPVLGYCHGFIGTQWIDGKRLEAGELTDKIMLTIGRYIIESGGPLLTIAEQEVGFARLREMADWNTRMVFGNQVFSTERFIKPNFSGEMPAYDDGRMAPQEWVQTPSGEILKVDSAGHDFEHTLIGRQPIYWDVAGTIVEWNFDAARIAKLLVQFALEGIKLDEQSLLFYKWAYAAFRLGQITLLLEEAANTSVETARLQKSHQKYATSILQLVGTGISPLQAA